MESFYESRSVTQTYEPVHCASAVPEILTWPDSLTFQGHMNSTIDMLTDSVVCIFGEIIT